ncbi:hypothetical protein RND71_043325 [Anisodus tanguticus]|uniref:Ubiquitinyl hydrolase 1 n=1 Tax=Anisodus tanguticus TaxID=243964 RepID=A0AAE1QRG5_9SOLA|nr:hypothetical protein RND71_043325 [Anisodus tanguticus]
MHRGQSAHSGHYIAQIRDRNTGNWYKFNDEFVEKIEGKNLKLGSEENKTDEVIPKLSKGQHVSDDAYMLVYKNANVDDTILPPDNSDKWDIPDYLQTILIEDNRNFEERIEIYNQIKNQNLAFNKEKQLEIKSIFEDLAKNENIESCEWIDKQWLVDWLSFDSSKQADEPNSEFPICDEEYIKGVQPETGFKGENFNYEKFEALSISGDNLKYKVFNPAVFNEDTEIEDFDFESYSKEKSVKRDIYKKKDLPYRKQFCTFEGCNAYFFVNWHLQRHLKKHTGEIIELEKSKHLKNFFKLLLFYRSIKNASLIFKSIANFYNIYHKKVNKNDFNCCLKKFLSGKSKPTTAIAGTGTNRKEAAI